MKWILSPGREKQERITQRQQSFLISSAPLRETSFPYLLLDHWVVTVALSLVAAIRSRWAIRGFSCLGSCERLRCNKQSVGRNCAGLFRPTVLTCVDRWKSTGCETLYPLSRCSLLVVKWAAQWVMMAMMAWKGHRSKGASRGASR